MYFNIATVHRLGVKLKKNKIPLLPKLLDAFIFFVFNSKVPFSATIGNGTFLVIGELLL